MNTNAALLDEPKPNTQHTRQLPRQLRQEINKLAHRMAQEYEAKERARLTKDARAQLAKGATLTDAIKKLIAEN